MKTFLILFAIFAASLGAVVPEEEEIEAHRELYISYQLYNNHYARGEIYTSKDTQIDNLLWDIPTVILIHGHGGSSRDEFSRSLRIGFTDNHDVNIFVMDWEHMASDPYEAVVSNFAEAAYDLTRFLMNLKDQYGSTDNTNGIHLVGFGIGAHLAGIAGNQLRITWPIARITGLDPTGKFFGLNTRHLSSHDALYVEIIHTDAGLKSSQTQIDDGSGDGESSSKPQPTSEGLIPQPTSEASPNPEENIGIGRHIGDVDFFVNGGSEQHGCETPICRHNRSWQLFVISLEYNHFLGNRCISIEQMLANTCTGLPLLMGGAELVKVPILPGIYRIATAIITDNVEVVNDMF